MCNDGRQVHAVSIEIINDKYVYNAIHTHTQCPWHVGRDMEGDNSCGEERG